MPATKTKPAKIKPTPIERTIAQHEAQVKRMQQEAQNILSEARDRAGKIGEKIAAKRQVIDALKRGQR